MSDQLVDTLRVVADFLHRHGVGDGAAAVDEAVRRLDIATLVAESWRDAAMRWNDLPMEGRAAAHPLACVLEALNGEADPAELGIAPTDVYFERILEAGRG